MGQAARQGDDEGGGYRGQRVGEAARWRMGPRGKDASTRACESFCLPQPPFPKEEDTKEGKENKESKPTDSRHDDSNSVGGFTNNADNSEGSEKEKDSDGDENKDSRG